ncbi:MAG TPA: deoxyribonuclease IV [Nitrososphaerales archaeon]|nr:deoxyribonuclease IV [Nitrososphaerales archaeon]
MAEPMLGLHVSIADSLDSAFDRATKIGCTTFQMFTRNPRGWKFKPLADDVVSAFLDKRKKSGFKRIVDHMPYLPNLASPDRGMMRASRKTLDAEAKRCDALGVDYLVAHLGSHMGKGSMVGVRNVAEAFDEAISGSSGETILLLENMAGQKNSVGARFEELRQILDLVKKGERAAVCFDTCHSFAAGFDLAGPAAVDRTMGLFDELVGLDRLKVVHLNDSKGPLGSNLDRHENIGKGKIGERGFRSFLHYAGVTERPLILETPYSDERTMKESLATVRRLLR